MKKSYITPAVKVRKVNTPTILAGSGELTGRTQSSTGYTDDQHTGGYAKGSYGMFDWDGADE